MIITRLHAVLRIQALSALWMKGQAHTWWQNARSSNMPTRGMCLLLRACALAPLRLTPSHS